MKKTMDKKTENFHKMLHVLIIFILFGLILRVYVASETYDCDQCSVNFKHKRIDFRGDMEPIKKEVSINRIYKAYMAEECPLTWDKESGFIGG